MLLFVRMKSHVLFIFLLVSLLGTPANSDGIEEMDSMTSFGDMTSLDVVSNEEQELERLMLEDKTDYELSHKASRLRCYSCVSTESWEHCEKTQILAGCPKASNRCVKGSISLKKPHGPIITEYFKGCVSEEKCDTRHFPACLPGSKESARCRIDCCDETFCNKEVYQPNVEAFREVSRGDDDNKQEIENKRSPLFNCKPPCLIYAGVTQINGIELKTSRKVQGMTSLKSALAIDVDMATQTLYWSDKKERVIKRANLLSGVTEVVIGGEGSVYEGIAVDWVGRLLYWTDKTHKRIEVAKLDGSSRKTILDKDLDKPRAIALDPEQGVLFFTDWGAEPRLERSSLAGQNRRVLITRGLKWPNGLVVDYTNKKLYICEANLDRIESVNYDGSGRRVLYEEPNIHPYDLALYQNTLYWGETTNGKSIEKIDIRTGKRLPGAGKLPVKKVLGVVVMDKTRQPRVNSLCSNNNGGCSHLCFATSPKSRVCGCPNGVTLLADQRTCDLGLTTTAGTTTVQPTTTAATTTSLPTTETTTAQPTTTMQPTTAPTTRSTTTQPVTTANPTETTKESTTALPSTQEKSTPTSQPTTQIRLVDGDFPNEGRVEVQHNGNWGTICDDYWDMRDATVVCRMLGFPEAIAAFTNAYFGPGRGKIWLDDVHCMGHESDISQCTHHGWGSHNCIHYEDAAVKCRPLSTPRPALPVRLVNGRSQREGRVEVYHAGQWGTICDDLWDKADADVVCRMLGYPGAIAATHRATFGQGTGMIWMDNVQCQGRERSIEECTRLDWGSNNCQHSEDAGVICRPVRQRTTPTPGPTTSPSPVEGFSVFCLPHSMHIKISRKQLSKMTSLKLSPGLLHLNDPSCGASKVSDTHVILSTPLDGCGTVRRRDGDTLTFTNKVYGQLLRGPVKRVFQSPPVTFPFKCSYSRITARDRIYTPAHAHGNFEQW